MKLILLFALSVACAGCGTELIGHGRAMDTAARELQRHGIVPPPGCTITITPDKKIEEPIKYVWAVTYSVTDTKKTLYSVWVNQYSGNVELFRDYRHTPPSKIPRVAWP